MFKKKECKKCGKKLDSNYDFCPYCGNSIEGKKKEDWGMLGKNDFEEDMNNFSSPVFEGISGKVLGKMLGSAMKMLEKELKSQNVQPQNNFELIINGKRVDPSNIKVSQRKVSDIPKKEQKEKTLPSYSSVKSKKFSKLSREEPKTNVRRFSNRIVYEINIPGVTSIDDVSMAKLESSVEIKAMSKKKSYFKIIPVDLPVLNYFLDKEILTVEFKDNN